ncbi:hypothetical protein BGX21_000934 [Mortierella sp. AD011]|nr:hypothetical protein BGX21_000934 [Mortierella sp. AD011]
MSEEGALVLDMLKSDKTLNMETQLNAMNAAIAGYRHFRKGMSSSAVASTSASSGFSQTRDEEEPNRTPPYRQLHIGDVTILTPKQSKKRTRAMISLVPLILSTPRSNPILIPRPNSTRKANEANRIPSKDSGRGQDIGKAVRS